MSYKIDNGLVCFNTFAKYVVRTYLYTVTEWQIVYKKGALPDIRQQCKQGRCTVFPVHTSRNHAQLILF